MFSGVNFDNVLGGKSSFSGVNPYSRWLVNPCSQGSIRVLRDQSVFSGVELLFSGVDQSVLGITQINEKPLKSFSQTESFKKNRLRRQIIDIHKFTYRYRELQKKNRLRAKL